MERLKLGTRDVCIEFPGVKALTDVNFEVCTGEVHAVVGANGAGKSTLMKVLAGANPGYTGDVYMDDNVVHLRSTMTANKHGIQIVYQEVDTALIPTLSVAENVMLNHMVLDAQKRPMVNWGAIRREAQEVLSRLHISMNVRTLVQNLTLAQKQMVLIAKAIVSKCNFLILDEPTAPLSDTETVELFRLIKYLRETENIAIVFISHRITEVLQICEKCTVMRDGKIVDTFPITGSTTTKEIIEKMLGRTFEEIYQKENAEIGDTVFDVSHLSGADGKINDVSLHIKRGEIVGIAGLVGAGKSELCKTIFGAYKKTGGTVTLNGKQMKIRIPTDAVKGRIALVPEERRKEGVLVEENVTFNLAAASLDRFCVMSFINKSKTNANAQKYVRDLNIVTPSIKQLVKNLSGGNQQKVAVGKWLSADCDVYIFDEPTKGVDVGAKQDIYHLVCDITKRGGSVIYASCENSELLSITDRIYVLYDGQVTAELVTADTNEDEIMFYAVGGKSANAVS